MDREASWSKKEEKANVESDEDNGDSDEEVIPTLDDDEESFVGKGKSPEKRTPAQSNPQPPNIPTQGERTHVAKASSSVPNVAISSNSSIPPLPPPPSIQSLPLKMGTGSDQTHEAIITLIRNDGTRNLRVNTKELQRVAITIMQTETVHIAQEITRRMLILFKQIEVCSFRYTILI